MFGLNLEAERSDDGVVRGRFFVKQDHQGPDGRAHPGILAAALVEALSLAQVREQSLDLHVSIDAAPPVGTFVEMEATDGEAVLRAEGLGVVASARSG